jgi:predicted transcriptional regulator
MAPGSGRTKASGLAGLRRDSTLGDLLFLYDCAAEGSTRLRPIADRLGVTVQAASHTYRKLARRGLVEERGDRYRPTVRGVAWLHRTLRALSDDVFARQQRLPIVRSCRAVAAVRVRPGEPVVLELIEGVLSARPGRGPGSQGRAVTGGPAGTLLEIGDLEGILRIPEAEVRVLTVSVRDLARPELVPAIERALTPRPPGLLGASGLEAFHLTSRAVSGPVVKFALGATAAEAAQVGVPSTIVVLDEDLPRLLDEFPVVERPRLAVRPVTVPSERQRRTVGEGARQRRR